MSKPLFKVLDWVETPIGPLCLRRRELVGRRGTIVTEVSVDHELLMTSLNTISEEALAREAIAWHGGEGLRVLVGGLGLGYTAAAALETGKVAQLVVVDRLPAVIGWLKDGLLPLSESLMADSRLELREDDVYAQLLVDPTEPTWDVIAIDVDHSPTEPLDPASLPFYTSAGLAKVARHLSPGGVLAVWSAGDDEPFAEQLSQSFAASERRRVHWINELIGEGLEVEDVIFLAREPV